MKSHQAALWLIALISGALFGLGLAVSGMIDPAKVQGFLNITGNWDPSLALVMGGALGVFAPGYWLWCRAGRAQCALGTDLPKVPKAVIDKRLLLGAAIFGIGWGLVGLCPGPALGLLGSVQWQAGLFVLAMLAGFWLVGRVNKFNQ